MKNTTFNDIAEIASKQYSVNSRKELEKHLHLLTKDCSTEVIKQLGLPQVLMFLSSTVAKSNLHEIIEQQDVEEAYCFLKYIISRNFLEKLVINNSINLGLQQTEKLTNKLSDLLKISGDMKSKSNLNAKINRLISFLKEQKLNEKHIKRIEIEIKATILLLARMISIERTTLKFKVTSNDIDIAYDIVRFMIFKLETIKLKILLELYSIDNENIWRKFNKMTFDQSAHDHLSSTAYAQWENKLPESFNLIKKQINCSSRPFIAAILGYSEIYGAKKQITRISTHELLYILEDFEKSIFGDISPMIFDTYDFSSVLSNEGIEVLSHISNWITTIIINRLGKDEFVLNFSSSLSRQMSLLFFISFVEVARDKADKLDLKQLLKALIKWTNLLKIIPAIEN